MKIFKDEEFLEKRLYVSLILMAVLAYIALAEFLDMPLPNSLYIVKVQYVVRLVLTGIIIAANLDTVFSGIKAFIVRSPNVDSLGTIAAGSAFVFSIITGSSYFDFTAIILTLLALGKYIEAIVRGKKKEAVEKLLKLVPETAVRIKDGKERHVALEDIKKGDVLVAERGERFVADGVILGGTSSVDESVITGEGTPVDKTVGDKVIGASTNVEGRLIYRAEAVGADTSFSKIINLVEEASTQKGEIGRLADKISKYYLPFIFILSIAVIFFWRVMGADYDFALTAGISVLIISCPCALVLARPFSVVSGMIRGGDNGILFKSASVMEIAGKTNVVILDKTGTITEGRLKVTDLFYMENEIPREVNLNGPIRDESPAGRFLSVMGGVEAKSNHPLGEAIVELADKKRLKFLSAENFKMIPGKGAQGMVREELFRVGSEEYILEFSTESLSNKLSELIRSLRERGKTVVLCGSKSEILGIIALADVVKETSGDAIQGFEKLGVRTIMLTGDKYTTAEHIRNQVGIEEVHAELLPEDKERITHDYQQRGLNVAFIGDGVNDAPSLLRADTGMAIGKGTDVAVESADIILMRSDLMDGVRALRLSKLVTRNIKQNVFLSFIFNLSGIPLAAGAFYYSHGVMLNPAIAAAAMILSAAAVALNSLRLRGTNIY